MAKIGSGEGEKWKSEDAEKSLFEKKRNQGAARELLGRWGLII
jgi:hypothetical protein